MITLPQLTALQSSLAASKDTVTTPYNGVPAPPATTVSVTGGTPNTNFSWTLAKPVGSTVVASGTGTLNSSGGVSFPAISADVIGTYIYTATFDATGHVRTATLTRPGAGTDEVVTVSNQTAQVGAAGISIYVTSGTPNTNFSWTLAKPVGSTVVASGTGTLNSSGAFTYTGITGDVLGDYTYTFTFPDTGHVRTAPTITLTSASIVNEVFALNMPSAPTVTAQFNTLMEHTSTGCQTLGTIFGAIGDAMFGSPNGLHSGITGIMQNVGEAMTAIGDTVGRLGDLLDGCLTTLGTLISNFANLTGATLALLDSIVTSLTAAAAAAVDAAIDSLAAVAGKLNEALSAVGGAVGTLLNLAGDVVGAVVNAGCGLIADGLIGLTGVTPAADQVTKVAAAAAAGLPPVTPFTPALGEHVMGSCTATSAALQTSLGALTSTPTPTPPDLAALTAAAASLNGLVP